jgi:hypothetical protein
MLHMRHEFVRCLFGNDRTFDMAYAEVGRKLEITACGREVGRIGATPFYPIRTRLVPGAKIQLQSDECWRLLRGVVWTDF